MKTKRILSLLAATTMAVTALTGAMTVSAVEADEGKIGENLTWTLDENGKLTISGDGAMASPSDLIVNAEPSDYSNIYTYKEEHMEDITAVEIKEGVTSIGFSAFYKMTNLETVVLPKSISKYESAPTATTSVPDYEGSNFAFAECTSLKNLTLTEGMTAIGAYSFYKCTALESVEIPASIETWGYYSFSECSKLKDIKLSDGLTILGGSAFKGTAVESIVIPASIKTWNHVEYRDREYEIDSNDTCYTFADCKKLSSVTFMNGLTKIGGGVFADCSSLRKVFIPKSVTNMEFSFAYCTGLQEAYIEDGTLMPATNYSDSGIDAAFSNCTNLKNLEIPVGVNVSYNNNTRYITGCSSLTDVYLHSKDYTFYIPDSSGMTRFHCYLNSSTYNTLLDKSKIPSDRLINIEDTIASAKNTLNTKLKDAKALNENDYTAESYAALKTAIDNAEKFDENSTQILPMQWAASDITSATRKLEEKPEPADYTAVDEALAKIPSDLSVYTDESVEALNDAKEAVVRDLTIDEQDRVNGFANAIEEAIAGLEKKQNSNTGSDDNNKPQNPNNNTNKPNQPTSSKDKGKTPTNKVTVPKPAQVKAVKASAKKKKLNVSWKKVSVATGYEVIYATNNKFTKGKKTVKVKKNKVTLKKLKAKKKYFVKVRAYKKVKGNVSYGKWSKVVKKKTK